MNGTHGQATVEWAGLLAIAAALGSALALIAGPPLVHAVDAAIQAALARGPVTQRSQPVATAADIADVQSALTGSHLTPDAALLALARRHARSEAEALAGEILLAAALRRAPALGTAITYRLHPPVDHRRSGRVPAGNDDRDLETPTGPPSAAWVTTAAQRTALAGALAHHTRKLDVVLGLVSFIGVPGAHRATELGASGMRIATRFAARHGQDTIDDTASLLAMADSLATSDDGVPGGMLAGDVVVSWPVHRTSWRDGEVEPASVGSDFHHVVYLRPVGGELAVVGEGREP